jgi:hypothetical protein
MFLYVVDFCDWQPPANSARIISGGILILQLDDCVGDTSVLEARRMEYAPLFADKSDPYFGVGRYVRPIDSSFRLWLHEGAADGSSCDRCNHHT